MSHPFVAPKHRRTAFNCPHCFAYSNMAWSTLFSNFGTFSPIDVLNYALCMHCKKHSIWHGVVMIYPDSSTAPMPNNDLPATIKTDYEEARSILNKSARGAAALLRLCIQKLCGHLGESGKDINADIAALVSKGLNPKIQKSLDIVRVIGNEAVHPGQIDLSDTPEIANKLFSLINLTVDALITQPRMIDETYNQLPPSKVKQIEERDGKTKPA